MQSLHSFQRYALVEPSVPGEQLYLDGRLLLAGAAFTAALRVEGLEGGLVASSPPATVLKKVVGRIWKKKKHLMH